MLRGNLSGALAANAPTHVVGVFRRSPWSPRHLLGSYAFYPEIDIRASANTLSYTHSP